MAEKVQFGTTVMPETVEAIERLAKVEGKSKGEFIDIAVAHYDSAPVIQETPDLPDEASVVVPIPRDRQMLIEVFGNVIESCVSFIHQDEIWKALLIARTTYQKTLPEFKSAERMRAEWQARRADGSRPLSYTKKGASLT